MSGLIGKARMYDVGGKLLNGIKSMNVSSRAYERATGGESGCFRIDSAVRQCSCSLGS